MKKAVIFFMLATMTMVALPGCGDNTKKTNSDVTTESLTISTATTESSSDTTDIKYADMIPNPEDIFKNGEIVVTDPDGGKAYMMQVTEYTEDEYDNYIAKCKEMGFTDISYDTSHDKGKDYGAYTSDKQYWVQVNLDSENKIIYIICQKSKHAE